MVAEHALKGSEAGGGIPEGVLSILGPWEEAAPAVLDPVAVCQELASEFLDLALSLAIRLGMVAGGQAHSEPLAVWRRLSTLWKLIAGFDYDYVFEDSVVPKDAIEQDFGRF